MNPDRDDDPILDACLDEVLGGRRPPDLTGRILEALRSSGGSSSLPGNDLATGKFLGDHSALAAPDDPVPPPVVSVRAAARETPQLPRVQSGASVAVSRRWSRGDLQRLLVGLAAGVIGLGFTLGIVAMMRSNTAWVVDRASVPDEGTPGAHGRAPERQLAVRAAPEGQPAKPAPSHAPPQLVAPLQDSATQPGDRQLAQHAPQPADASSPRAAERPFVRTRRDLARSPDGEIVALVNAELARGWKEAGVKPSAAATDGQWCERVFRTLLGRSPKADELRRFTENKQPDRRERLVAQLLEESGYAAEYARHWSKIWTRVLWGEAALPGPAASRDDLERYVQGALLENRPYDQMVFELLTASGAAKPGGDDYNPAVNFLLHGLDAAGTRPATRVARVFLGHRLQCAQCHTHPTQDWTQAQYWSLAAFFRQTTAAMRDGVPLLADADFTGQRRGSTDGEVYYETPDGLMKTAFPQFLDGQQLATSGRLAAVQRRRELAQFVVDSDRLPRATVNRVWAQVFGFGFVRPVDDLGPHAAASQPAAFDRLSTEFAAHEFDLRRLLKWAVLSDPFARSSSLTDLATKDVPEEGQPALFSRYYERPAQAGDAARSLVQAVRIRQQASSGQDVRKARVDWLAQFNRAPAAGKKLASKAKLESPAILVTGPPPRSITSQEYALLEKIAASKLPFDKQVEHLFWTALDREPTRREQRLAADALTTAGGDARTALEDIWWALVTSSESTLDR